MLGFIDEAEKEIDYRLKLYGIFTNPEVAMVGMSETKPAKAVETSTSPPILSTTTANPWSWAKLTVS